MNFRDICIDVEAICIGLDIPKPLIIPMGSSVVISVGEDSFMDDPFPFSTLFVKCLDEYFGCSGELYVVNNSVGDDFQPCIRLRYDV